VSSLNHKFNNRTLSSKKNPKCLSALRSKKYPKQLIEMYVVMAVNVSQWSVFVTNVVHVKTLTIVNPVKLKSHMTILSLRSEILNRLHHSLLLASETGATDKFLNTFVSSHRER
jgi:hypothetical protein